MDKQNQTNADGKIYKHDFTITTSSLRIVSMIPGDRKVAGCFVFSDIFRRCL